MSVARTRCVLQSIAATARRHHRKMAVAAVLTAGLLVGGFQIGGIAGLALVLALLTTVASSVLGVRLRALARSHAALALVVTQLSARVDRLQVDADAAMVAGEPAGVPIDPVPAEPDGAPDAAVGADHVAGVSSTMPNDPTLMVADVDRTIDEHPSVPNSGPAAPMAATDQQDEVVPGTDGTPEPDAVPIQPVGLDPAPSSPVGLTLVADQASAPLAMGGEIAEVPGLILAELPPFALTSLRGDLVTVADLARRPAVIVFWRPGCPHCQRLTPELVAWESLQGPRLVVIAACDGPTAFRAGLPGTVLLDPGFTVGQALGAPGTPAALPIDSTGQPSGLVVAGASAVTTLLLDAMRDWASSDSEPEMVADADPDETPAVGQPVAGEVAPPAVLLRRVEEIRRVDDEAVPGWDGESASRRAG